MHDKMMKMLMGKKKEGKTLSDSEKKSKLQALGGMRDMASQMMGDKLKNLKKVTVASNSPDGLKKGLHQAEDLVDQSPQDEEKPDSDPNNMNEGGSAYAQGGKVGQLPSEFDRDEDHVQSEHERDNSVRAFSGGGSFDDEESSENEGPEHESLDEMVQESPDDLDKLDELIKMLEEKKQKLSNS